MAAGVEPDAAREEHLHERRLARVALRQTELEDAGVLQEELALLGEEEGEAGEVDLLLVGLDLGEVGVEREIEREAARDPPLEVEAQLDVVPRRVVLGCGAWLSSPTRKGFTLSDRDGSIPRVPSRVPASEMR